MGKASYSKSKSTQSQKGFGSSSATLKDRARLDPYARAQSGLHAGLDASTNIFNNALAANPFPEQQVVPFAPQTEQAFDYLTNAAGSANPVVQAAASANTSIANGTNPFLQNIGQDNPYQRELFNQHAGDLAANLRTQFAGGGMAGGANHAQAYGNSLARFAADYGANTYAQNQQNQLAAVNLQTQAAAQAGAIGQAQGIPAQFLAQIGSAQEERSQSEIDRDIQENFYLADRGLNVYNQFLPTQAQIAQAFGENQMSRDTTATENYKGSGTSRGSQFGLNIGGSGGLAPDGITKLWSLGR